MIKKFCDACGVEINSQNSTHRNVYGELRLTTIFVITSENVIYCDACLLHKFQRSLSPD